MTTTYVKASDPSIARLLRATGATSFRDVELVAAPEVTLQNTFWDGGGRYSYLLIRLADAAVLPIPDQAPPAFGGADLSARPLPIPEGAALVELGHGTARGVRVYTHPSSLAPLLPAPGPDLSWAERVVLAATRSLISSARLSEARRETGISSEDYSAARASLIARRLLNKAGAITTEGRNAIGREELFTLGKNRPTV